MKILLLGKTGRIGQALDSVLQDVHEVFAPLREECDVTKPKQIERTLQEHTPDLIINATGYTAVDRAEQEQTLAMELNREVPKNLAELASKNNISLLHFSTDYVFNGNKLNGYFENDAPHPISIYGISKAAGEEAIQKTLSNFFIVRTAWVYGPGGKNFVDTMLDLAAAQKPIKVVTDQVGSPTYTLDLAKAVLRLLKTKKYGIYHIVNSGSANWYDFAVKIFQILGVPQKIEPIASSRLNRSAKRPSASILLNTKCAPLRPWQEALAEYLQGKTIIL